VALLDTLASARNAAAWVEKTPDHVLRIDTITQVVPGAMFLHVVRPPAEVVVSLREATRRWGRQRSWLRCWLHWYFALKETQRRQGLPGHRVVVLDELARHPRREAEQICAWLGLPWHEDMIERRQEAAHKVILTEEIWKSRVTLEIASRQLPLDTVPVYLRPIVSLSQVYIYEQLLGHRHAASCL
jgi:hypothetical protein